MCCMRIKGTVVVAQGHNISAFNSESIKSCEKYDTQYTVAWSLRRVRVTIVANERQRVIYVLLSYKSLSTI
jgi:hypothetical protein